MEVSRHGIRIGIKPMVNGLINVRLSNAVRPVTGTGAAGIERNADGDGLAARVGDNPVHLPMTQYGPERPCGCQRMSRAKRQFVRHISDESVRRVVIPVTPLAVGMVAVLQSAQTR